MVQSARIGNTKLLLRCFNIGSIKWQRNLTFWVEIGKYKYGGYIGKAFWFPDITQPEVISTHGCRPKFAASQLNRRSEFARIVWVQPSILTVAMTSNLDKQWAAHGLARPSGANSLEMWFRLQSRTSARAFADCQVHTVFVILRNVWTWIQAPSFVCDQEALNAAYRSSSHGLSMLHIHLNWGRG